MRTYSQRTDHRHGDGRRPKCAKTRALPYEIPFARWRREIHEGRRRYELYLIDDADQDRLERGDVKEIISQDYGFDDASPFAVWPWTDFGKVMSNELIAQNIALYPVRGAESKQS